MIIIWAAQRPPCRNHASVSYSFWIALELGLIQHARLLSASIHDELVRHQRDKLAVGGLVVLGVDIVAEELVDVLDLAARPCDFDGMADGALDL